MKVKKLDKKVGIGIEISGSKEEMEWFEKEIVEKGRVGEKIVGKACEFSIECEREDVRGMEE